MNKINLAGVPIEHGRSPRGRYRRLEQNISAALAGLNGIGQEGQQPFSVDLVRLPAGAANWPYHSHSAQWELYLVLSGRGKVRTPDGVAEVREGDCVLHPPGEAHHMKNTGATDLVYYLISSNSASDVCHFPDTDRWSWAGQKNPARLQPSTYYEGEE